MEQIKPYAKTVDLKTKKKIWRLYFDEFYSYQDILRCFKWKFTAAQLKSIIMERYEYYGERD